MRKSVIWGAGHHGGVALEYYKKFDEIVGFIDRSETVQNTLRYGLPVFSPDVLKDNNWYVIIAVSAGIEEVEEVLCNKYSRYDYTIFGIRENIHKDGEQDISFDDNTVILRLSAGLGNQMFQYALAKCYELKGRNVLLDLSLYNDPRMRSFGLKSVFSKIKTKSVIFNVNSLRKNILSPEFPNRFSLYTEESIFQTDKKCADISILEYRSAVIKGMFQTRVFAEMAKKELQHDFIFDSVREKKLEAVAEQLREGSFVSIHIRRGDYLEGQNIVYYSGICTDKYYERAIDYLKKHDLGLKFCFFSNDIEWVRSNYKYQDAVYIDRDMFDDYEDWYDMYLMSICRYNIIANSTFSWWGAWLNRNPDKIVIAPKKWINGCDYLDIYPEEWVVL